MIEIKLVAFALSKDWLWLGDSSSPPTLDSFSTAWCVYFIVAVEMVLTTNLSIKQQDLHEHNRSPRINCCFSKNWLTLLEFSVLHRFCVEANLFVGSLLGKQVSSHKPRCRVGLHKYTCLFFVWGSMVLWFLVQIWISSTNFADQYFSSCRLGRTAQSSFRRPCCWFWTYHWKHSGGWRWTADCIWSVLGLGRLWEWWWLLPCEGFEDFD